MFLFTWNWIEFQRTNSLSNYLPLWQKSILLQLFNGILNHVRMAHNQIIIYIYCHKENRHGPICPAWNSILCRISTVFFDTVLLPVKTIDEFIQLMDIILFSICPSWWTPQEYFFFNITIKNKEKQFPHPLLFLWGQTINTKIRIRNVTWLTTVESLELVVSTCHQASIDDSISLDFEDPYAFDTPSSFRYFTHKILLQIYCMFMSRNFILIAVLHLIHSSELGRFQASWKAFGSTNSVTTMNSIVFDSVIGKDLFSLFASATTFKASRLKDASRLFIALTTFGLTIVSNLGCTLT